MQAQPFHLSHCTGVPGFQTFHSKWQEGDALAVAWLPRLVQLTLVSFIEGVAWGGCCSSDLRILKRIDDSHIQGRISPIGPARDEDVSWPSPFPRQQKATLFGWSQRSSCCCAVKEVSVWFIQIRHLCSRYNLLDPLQVLAAPPHQDLVVPAPPGSLQGSGPVEVSCLKNHRQ